MSAPLPEYTISGNYSSDRLRGARPNGSPRRLAVAGRDVSHSLLRSPDVHLRRQGAYSKRLQDTVAA